MIGNLQLSITNIHIRYEVGWALIAVCFAAGKLSHVVSHAGKAFVLHCCQQRQARMQALQWSLRVYWCHLANPEMYCAALMLLRRAIESSMSLLLPAARSQIVSPALSNHHASRSAPRWTAGELWEPADDGAGTPNEKLCINTEGLHCTTR